MTARPRARPPGLEALRIGLLTQADTPETVQRGLARLCKIIVAGGGSVVLSDKDGLWGGAFSAELGSLPAQPDATLGYGQAALQKPASISCRIRAGTGARPWPA